MCAALFSRNRVWKHSWGRQLRELQFRFFPPCIYHMIIHQGKKPHFTPTSLAHLPVFDHNPLLWGNEWSVLPSRFADSQLPFKMPSVRTAVSAWRSFPCDRSGLTAKPLMHYRKSLCSPSRCNVEMTSRRNRIPAFSSHLFE